MSNELRAILKPFGYKENSPLLIKEALFNYEKSPIVAFGVDKGSHIEYSSALDDNDLLIKLEESKKQAFENNSQIEVEYSVEVIDGEKLFVVTPHEYASEKILDQSFLKTVGQELGSESLLIAIPHQGVFMAIDSSSDFRGKLAGFAKDKYENPEANPITPHIFEIQNQVVVGVGGEDLGEDKNDSIIQKSNGDYIVQLNSSSFDEFKNEVSTGYSLALLMAMKNKDFSGKIIFNQTNLYFIFSEEVLEKCRSFTSQIENNEMAQLISKTMSGNGISPSFTLLGDPIDYRMIENTPDKPTIQPSTESTKQSNTHSANKTNTPKPTKKKWWKFW